METIKDGGSVNKPPIFDGTNYDHWKAMIVVFLKSMGNKAWKVVIRGWKHPVVTFEDGTTSLKPEVDWNDVEDEKAFGNSKDLNFIFNGVGKNMFMLINTCLVAKEA